MASVSIKITGETENDPITEINCGRTFPKLGGNINISTFPELTGFTCEYNDIQNISNLALNPNLQRVEIDGNKLTTVNSGSSLSSNLYLQHFNCSDNLLTGSIFDLSLNNLITYFNCSGNKFTGFTSGNQIPYTLETFNANNNNLYQTSVDSILDAFLKNNRNSSYGFSDIDLGGFNRHPSTYEFGYFGQYSGDLFQRSGNIVTASSTNIEQYYTGKLITISEIENAEELNGTYIVSNTGSGFIQYNTTGSGFLTGAGVASIRIVEDNDTNLGFYKYQVLALPTGQFTIAGDEGRGLNVKINSFFEQKYFLSETGNFVQDVSINGNGDILAIIDRVDTILYLGSSSTYRIIRKRTDETYSSLDSQTFINAGTVNISDGVSINTSMNKAGDIVAFSFMNNTQNYSYVKVYKYMGNYPIQIGGTIDPIETNIISKVDLNSNGNRVVVTEQSTASGFGSVRVFENNGSSWTQLGNTILGGVNYAKILDAKINAEGDVLIINYARFDGTFSYNDGLIKIFNWDGANWNENVFDSEFEYLGVLFTSISINAYGNRFAATTASNDSYVAKYIGSQFTLIGDTIFDNIIGAAGEYVKLNDIGDRVIIASQFAIRNLEFNGIFWEPVAKILEYPPYFIEANSLADKYVMCDPYNGFISTVDLPKPYPTS